MDKREVRHNKCEGTNVSPASNKAPTTLGSGAVARSNFGFLIMYTHTQPRQVETRKLPSGNKNPKQEKPTSERKNARR